ncbi:TPA: hypothetical protein ACPZRY_004355 [Yersinia enterocolitica]|uniref:hypothetical protein n=1 Tax=Yersinia TaxID=629 RepID=UPI000BFD123B|nr:MULTISPECIES: hypothetical protein [Yersinia]ATM86681.1 hypothetical protein CRN74_11645 [Yersinia frederiksenii]EKN4811350.1 hypothetical protein [Yersinia enterocolitica]EKN6369242.1 hypothetical protein [Yersinia enterocolitica]MBW5853122.1 hypothetical protein [Yersinia enterocolitica]HDL6480490.1 hypothetical protein [Yersinia enterocolitica]
MKNKFKLITLIFITSITSSSLAAKNLTNHDVLVDCNKSASSLVESYEKDVKLIESKRLDLISLISEGCQSGYKSAHDGMQYKDIERGILADARKEYMDLDGQNLKNSELRVGLILASIQAGYYIYNNGGLTKN